MDFDLSSDQLALREAAADLLDNPRWKERLRERIGPGTVVGTLPGSKAGEETRKGNPVAGYDTELWEAMVDQGWLGVELSEADGGFGGGMVEIAVLAEEIGRRVAAVPFLETVVAGDTAPAAAGWSPEPLQVGSGPTLTGVLRPVTFGVAAHHITVPLASGLFRISTEGLGLEPVTAMDRTREVVVVRLDATPAEQVGGPQESTRFFDRYATGLSAQLLGGASAALDMAVAYAKDRVQFGKPIGSFQAVKHRLADALVDVEGMRSTVYYAAWCLSAGVPEASLASSMAKAWCSAAAHRVLASSLQVHGGIGFTWEHDLHLYLKRSQLDEVSFGDAAFHRRRIAGLLKTRLAEGAPLF